MEKEIKFEGTTKEGKKVQIITAAYDEQKPYLGLAHKLFVDDVYTGEYSIDSIGPFWEKAKLMCKK